MISKFGFGELKFTVNTGAGLPGHQTRMLGGRLVPVGSFSKEHEDYEYEFGEVVEIVRDTDNTYIVKPVDATTNDESLLAVIMADVAAGTKVTDRLIRKARPNVGLSLYALVEGNHGAVSVPFAAEDIEISEKVAVGTGQDGTVQGAVYPAGTEGTVEIKGFYSKSKPNTPTVTDAKVITIGGLI